MAQSRPAAAYTVAAGEEGFYAISESSVKLADDRAGRAQFRVYVRRAGMAEDRQPQLAVLAGISAGEAFDFDTFLGYLGAGDTVHIGLGDSDERAKIGYRIARTPSIPVSVFPEDAVKKNAIDAPGGWSLLSDVAAGSAAARLLAWNDSASRAKKFALKELSAQVQLDGGAKESIAAFRVPRSGYYALHDSWATLVAGARAEARIYVGRDAGEPSATFPLAAGKRVGVNLDLGYLQKGEIAYLALSANGPATVDFAAAVVEWAPRRAPLRVRRGEDGLLDVYEPTAPRQAVDIPAERWITVPAREGDATEAIRKAIAEAGALQQRDGGYAGIRLETGKRYVLASKQDKGVIFEIKNSQRFVFDGNGATLFVNSPEIQRERIGLFTTTGSRDVALADFAVDTASNGFSVGEILDVGPMEKGNQTVTFRLLPGQPDPIADLRRGQANGYPYDAQIPGRSAMGTWSHYPGADVRPQLQATEQPGVFKHTVTRTNQSISVGDKWLIKNKSGGIHFLTAGGGSENITLSGVVDKGCASGFVHFWQASGINVIDCTFEPQGANWISSTSDAVHGRGREGVWVENTLIRGICEDVMNTYALSLVIPPDDQPDDNVISLGVFNGSRRDRDGEYILGNVSNDVVQVGDELLFFDPAEGRVLGYATVREIPEARRFVLSNSVPGIRTWRKGGGKNAGTIVYNTRSAGRFFVRDSRIMDSMRFGVFIKARGGAIFNTHFEGLASNAIFAANEPTWPEGPPPTHLWLQGNTFYQNNYGYTGLNRAWLTVDPAEVSIFTSRLRNPDVPDGFATHITRGQYPISHMKIVGNTFLDWHGMGIAARNTRSLIISDNLFLPPRDDQKMRKTLAKDPAMTRDGVGRYAAIFMDTVNGGLISGNRFIGLPEGDQAIVRDQDVQGVVESDNIAGTVNRANLDVMLPFAEWFGTSAAEPANVGSVQDRVELRGATHRVGRLGAGLTFNGKDDLAVLKASADLAGKPLEQLSLAMWVRPAGASASDQVIYSQGDAQRGVVMAITKGRLVAGLWQAENGQWLDFGPGVDGLWQHIALVYDGRASTLRGYVDGIEISNAKGELPEKLDAITKDATLGGLLEATRLGRGVLAPGTGAYEGDLDELCLFSRSISPAEVSCLAMRRSSTVR